MTRRGSASSETPARRRKGTGWRGLAVAALVVPAACIAAGVSPAGPAPDVPPVEVFRHAQGDWYRLPSLAVTARGTVLAFAGRRKGSSSDFGHETDVVLRRSTDGGRTFGAMQTIATRVGADIHTGPVVIDSKTGRIFKFCRFWPATNDPQTTVSKTPYVKMKELGWLDHVMVSDDDGVTWSAPRALPLDYPDRATSCGTGNGVHGIQLAGGRLLVQGGCVLDGRRHIVLAVSDDAGATWTTRLAPTPDEGGIREFGLAELADGGVYANLRSHSGFRWAAVSRDRGDTFPAFAMDRALPDPGCHAGLVRLAGAPPDRLAFSNPSPPAGARPRERSHLAVRFSGDGGRTWGGARAVDDGPAAYSDLAALPDGSLLCLYEGGKTAYDGILLAHLPPDAKGP